MKPQVGDIWEYVHPDNEHNQVIALIHKILGSHPSHFSSGIDFVYYGQDLLTGEYEEFLFNEGNMAYWSKLA